MNVAIARGVASRAAGAQAVTAVNSGDIDVTLGSPLNLVSRARNGRARLPGPGGVPAIGRQVALWPAPELAPSGNLTKRANIHAE